jgi:hypothetical protein
MLFLYRDLRWLFHSIRGLWSDDPVEVAVARRVWAFLIPLGIAQTPGLVFVFVQSFSRLERWVLAVVVVTYLYPFAHAAVAIGRRDASEEEVFWFQAPPPLRELLEAWLRQVLTIVWGLAALNATALVLHQTDVLTDGQMLVMLASVFAVLAPPTLVAGGRARQAWLAAR